MYLDGPGGVIHQLLSIRAALERAGHQVTLFDQWNTSEVRSYPIFHLFVASGDTLELGKRMRLAGLKLVVSPIIDKAIPEWIIRVSNEVVTRIPKVYTHLGAASLLCKLADMSIARSEEEVGKLTVALGVPRAKVAMVYNGVDMKFANAKPDLFVKKYHMQDFLLAVGLIGNPNKNFLRLIRIANEIKVPTVLVGPIQNTDYARACMKAAEASRYVEVLGPISEEELISAYAAANTLALPSIIEGTGLVALEAGLAGAKVVITQNGGTKDYFANYVDYVDPRSDVSIRTGILRALEQPKGERLKLHIAKHFTWDAVAIQQVTAYEKALA